ncbi:MAG: ACP phosphodiesterase [Xanthomonadaceae bacterium]|nr:ACP phosphodiesterase [Xanthomonadaceae bacterium]
MNFIGHALLAQRGNDDFLFGNLVADGIKGSDLSALPDDVARGVRLHRRVDSGIDRHPCVSALRARMPARRVAGIALDLVWDHFLSRDWLTPELAERCYAVLSSHPIPERSASLVSRLLQGRWLEHYADFDFCCQAILGVGKRLRGIDHNPLTAILPWLWSHHDELEDHFNRLWPDLLDQYQAV